LTKTLGDGNAVDGHVWVGEERDCEHFHGYDTVDSVSSDDEDGDTVPGKLVAFNYIDIFM
jgi:hypothetical protein